MKTRFLSFLVLIFISLISTEMAFSQSEITTFILVRHAEKVDESRNPELNEAGKERALALRDLLSNTELDAIYSTDYIRTIDTVKPIAELKEMEVLIYKPSSAQFIRSILKDHRGETVLVSGHSNTTPAAVNALLGEKAYENMDHDEYGTIYMVSVVKPGDAKVTKIHY